MEATPRLIEGGVFSDDRGSLQFVNDFDMSEIKRMYITTHPNTKTIRAWQGHKIEKRWFFCVKGSFKVKLVKIDNWDNPSSDCKLIEFELSENTPQVLYVPNGYANGFKAIEDNSKIMLLSDYGLNEIEDDNYRFDNTKWANWDT